MKKRELQRRKAKEKRSRQKRNKIIVAEIVIFVLLFAGMWVTEGEDGAIIGGIALSLGLPMTIFFTWAWVE